MDVDKQPWYYEFKESDPSEAKAAYEELMKDEDEPLVLLDIEDEYDCSLEAALVFKDGQQHLVTADIIHIDYKEKTLELPKEVRDAFGLKQEKTNAKDIRYCGLPVIGHDGSKNKGELALLSLWNAERGIVNIRFVLDECKSTMLLLHAVTRLIYESFDQSAYRTHKFFLIVEGPVDVATCSKDERDMRDLLKHKKIARKEMEEAAAEEGGPKPDFGNEPEPEIQELKKTSLYVVFDEEAILLYENPFAPHPLHDFRFYREKHPKAIDNMFIAKADEELEIEQKKNVFYIYLQPDNELADVTYKRLIELLKKGDIRAKYEKVFVGSGKEFEDFFKNPPQEEDEDSLDSSEELGDLKGTPMAKALGDYKQDRKFRKEFQAKVAQRKAAAPAAGQPGPTSASSANYDVFASAFKTNLLHGDHLKLDDMTEEMQMDWLMKESQLDAIITENQLPDVGEGNFGMNSSSAEDFYKAVTGVREKLVTNSNKEAISKLRICLKVFGSSMLNGYENVAPTAKAREIELLKRIYFLSGR